MNAMTDFLQQSLPEPLLTGVKSHRSNSSPYSALRAFLQNPESWDFHRGLLVIHPF